jgi:hypothetical protein
VHDSLGGERKKREGETASPRSPEETRSGRAHDLEQMETVDYVGVDQTRYGFILKEKRNAGRGESKVKPKKRKTSIQSLKIFW